MKKTKVLRISIFCVFLVSLFLVSSLGRQLEISTSENPGLEDNLNQPAPKVAGDGALLLSQPYFKYIMNDLEWMDTHLQDNITKEYVGNFYHEVDETGVLVDGAHYTEEYMHYLGGTYKLFFTMPLMWKTAYTIINSTPAYNSTDHAFYSWASQEWDSVSGEYMLVDNALPIIYLAGMCTTLDPELPNTYGGEIIVKQHWDTINLKFWDQGRNLYNYSSTDSSKVVRSELIAAIANLMIHRTNIGIDDAIRTNAFIRGNDVIESLIVNHFYNNPSGYFEYSKSADLSTGDNHMDLETNAWGTLALVELFVEGNQENETIIQMAERVAQSTRDVLLNSTYGLLMEKAFMSPTSIADATLSLKSNAVMMQAYIKLFEATGNLTYFNWAYQSFTKIEEHLRDNTNGFLHNAIGQNEDLHKSIGGFGLYSLALGTISNLVKNTTLDVTLNQTELIYLENEEINITAKYNLIIDTVYLGVTDVQKNVQVGGASVQLYFLNSNNQTKYILNGTTDVNGTFTINWTIPQNFEPDMYSIYAHSNLTGMATAFVSTEFDYNVGLDVDVTPLFESVASGNTEQINLTIKSQRKTNLTLEIKTDGEDFVLENNGFYNITNASETHHLINVTAKEDSVNSSASLNIKFYNGSVLVLTKEIPINCINPIHFLNTREVAYSFIGAEFEIKVNVENLRKYKTETIRISVDGIYVEDSVTEHDIEAKSLDTITLRIKILENAPRTVITFNLTITRVFDNSTVVSFLNSLTIKAKIELDTIIVPKSIPQGKNVDVYFKFQNNKEITQKVNIFVDGVQVLTGVPLVPGENYITVPLQKAIINPYDFGTKTYQVNVQDEQGNILYTDFIEVNVELSPGAIVFGYFLPVLIPILGIAIIKQRSIEMKKRIV